MGEDSSCGARRESSVLLRMSSIKSNPKENNAGLRVGGMFDSALPIIGTRFGRLFARKRWPYIGKLSLLKKKMPWLLHTSGSQGLPWSWRILDEMTTAS